MKVSKEHIVGLDNLLAKGATLDIDGKNWTFSPLTFSDLAEVVNRHKQELLKSYLQLAQHGLTDPMKRGWDMNTIWNRPVLSDEISLSDPGTLLCMIYLSLKHKHPDVTAAQVDSIVSSDSARQKIADLITVMSFGPLDPGAGGAGNTDPT